MRYRALAGLAREHGAPLVLLAHHRGDQAETVLLRLLRGTGLAGMVAMAPLSRRDEVDYLRPWLDQDRDDILRACARLRGGHRLARGAGPDQFRSPLHLRAALRELLAPALTRAGPAGAASWRGMRATWPRPRRSWQVAREDFAALEPGPDGASFRCARGAICRRRGRRRCCAGGWTPMARACLRKRACDLLRQLRGLHSLGHDRQLRVEQAGHAIRCHRGRVWLSVAESRSGLAGTPLSPGRAGRCCG